MCIIVPFIALGKRRQTDKDYVGDRCTESLYRHAHLYNYASFHRLTLHVAIDRCGIAQCRFIP